MELPGASYRVTSHGDRRNLISVARDSPIALLVAGSSRFANQACSALSATSGAVNTILSQRCGVRS